MAHTKSTRSVRSVRSIRSSTNRSSAVERAFREGKKANGEIHSFERMLLMACARFRIHCPYTVTVTKELIPDYYKYLKRASVKSKSKRISVLPDATVSALEARPERNSSTETSLTAVSSENLPTIKVTVVYDKYNTLTEVLVTRKKDVPRSFLRIIHLLLPYYRNLARITMSKCGMNMYTIYKLSKILETSTIAEICLDDSPLSGADCALLLEATKLRYLSLCRCNVQDDTCTSIAEKLHHAESARNLLLLNLSSNRITDEGATNMSDALRTNRHLRYLNLAGNHITDCGAGRILDSLTEFPLTCDEIVNTRRRRLEYLKCRNDMYAKYLAQLRCESSNDVDQLSRKSVIQKRRKTSLTTLRNKSSSKKEKEQLPNSDDEYLKTKADMLTTEVLGPFEDPFHSESVKLIDGCVYSTGNMTLAYLNLAYNNLSYMSVRKLQNVIKYQNSHKSSGGLVKVVLEGNNLPISCSELTSVNETMSRNIVLKNNR